MWYRPNAHTKSYWIYKSLEEFLSFSVKKLFSVNAIKMVQQGGFKHNTRGQLSRLLFYPKYRLNFE